LIVPHTAAGERRRIAAALSTAFDTLASVRESWSNGRADEAPVGSTIASAFMPDFEAAQLELVGLDGTAPVIVAPRRNGLDSAPDRERAQGEPKRYLRLLKRVQDCLR